MRVTESRLIDLAQSGMAKANSELSNASTEMSSGMRVEKPSQDPASWADGMRVHVRQIISTGRGAAMDRAQEGLLNTDAALDTIGRTMSRARELAVQMANGALSSDERTAAANEVNQLRDTIISAADARGSDGQYLLAGTKSDLVPFAAAGSYAGDALTRSIETSETGTSAITVSGNVLTAAAGVDVLATLSSLSTALSANNVPAVQTTLDALATGISQIAGARTQVGTRLTTLASADTSRRTFELNLATIHTRDVEADPIAAASNLARAKQALDAAQTVASQLVQMTKPPQNL